MNSFEVKHREKPAGSVVERRPTATFSPTKFIILQGGGFSIQRDFFFVGPRKKEILPKRTPTPSLSPQNGEQ